MQTYSFTAVFTPGRTVGDIYGRTRITRPNSESGQLLLLLTNYPVLLSEILSECYTPQ